MKKLLLLAISFIVLIQQSSESQSVGSCPIGDRIKEKLIKEGKPRKITALAGIAAGTDAGHKQVWDAYYSGDKRLPTRCCDVGGPYPSNSGTLCLYYFSDRNGNQMEAILAKNGTNHLKKPAPPIWFASK